MPFLAQLVVERLPHHRLGEGNRLRTLSRDPMAWSAGRACLANFASCFALVSASRGLLYGFRFVPSAAARNLSLRAAASKFGLNLLSN